ncbi:hypothetical protein EDB92DRAFT_1820937 [Lactarius akahatsu]|uniref:Uncharacterized protein n=1 Tax=Lactarius akahatsu TaxID=416441 RepID=A0AAD4L472_9AGAM|nr:hypothetical protein EDB92DRAFT_1820937 [Lactarius akahatsu]
MTTAQTMAIIHGLLDNMKVVMDGGEVSTSAIQWNLIYLNLMEDTSYNARSGDQFQKDARGWISPPDPSKNHIIARRGHHSESSVWFTHGNTFNKWIAAGSLLWICGNLGSGKYGKQE